MVTHSDDIFELAGALHLHTVYSDGSVDYPELRSVAREVGLDYIVTTDHMTLDAFNKGEEGEEEGLFTLVGYEHNDEFKKNHYLVMGVNAVAKNQKDAAVYVREVQNLGGIGFMAHPAEKRDYFKRYPSYPWTDWEITGVTGIEIWNQMSEWVENLKNWGSFIRIFYPRRFHRGAPKKVLKFWDKVNQKRFLSAIGGVDAHTFRYSILGICFYIFPLKVELKGVRTYVYLSKNPYNNDFQESKSVILSALEKGNGFIGYYRRGDAAGSLFYLEDKKGNKLLPGVNESSPVLPGKLHVKLPEAGEICLIKNGDFQESLVGHEAVFEINKNGVYRIEVKKGRMTWIYSNPFPVGIYPII